MKSSDAVAAVACSYHIAVLTVLIVLSTLCVRSGHCQERILFQHSGYVDPSTEGFSPFSGGGPVLDGVINDLGFDAWLTRFSGVGGISYSRTIPDFARGPWTLSLTLRIVTAGTSGTPFRATLGGSLGIFGLYLGSEPDGDPIVRAVNGVARPTFVLEGQGSSYHNYRLIFDSSSRTADLWVDGTRMLTGLEPQQRTVSTPYFAWGGVTPFDGTNNVPGEFQANWNLVSLEIPEPAPLTLFAFGAFALTTQLRKRRQSPSR